MSQIRLLQGQEPSELQKGRLFDYMFIVAEAWKKNTRSEIGSCNITTLD